MGRKRRRCAASPPGSGSPPNTVYTYFPDKAAVVAALVDRLLGEVGHDVFADRSQPWRLRVESLALELRQRLTTHPGAVRLMISSPMTGPRALTLSERLLHLLATGTSDPAPQSPMPPAVGAT